MANPETTVSAQSGRVQTNKASGAASRTASGAESAAATLWRAVTTACPIQGSASAATFFEQPIYGFNKGRLNEFLDAWTKILPLEITEADRPNGVQFRGTAVWVLRIPNN